MNTDMFSFLHVFLCVFQICSREMFLFVSLKIFWQWREKLKNVTGKRIKIYIAQIHASLSTFFF